MENIKAIDAVRENDNTVIHCHHNVNASLAALISVFEDYGNIKLIEPRYSFQGTRLGTTKIFYLNNQDAITAANEITKKARQATSKPSGTIPKVSRANATRSPAEMKNREENPTSVNSTTPYDLEINASDEKPFYAIHEWGRKLYIIVPEGYDYAGVFKGTRQYGEIEYIHMTKGKEQKRIALICYYDKESAQAALHNILPLCRPQLSYPQKIVDFSGKIYRLHEDCNRKVSLVNFNNHKLTCALEQKRQGATKTREASVIKTNIDSEEKHRTADEKDRKLLIVISAEDDIESLDREFEKFGSIEYIRPNENAGIAYVCYFQAESAYQAITKADQKYKIKTVAAERLTGFKGPLRSMCSRCKQEVSAPHKAYHLAICKGRTNQPSSKISDRLKPAYLSSQNKNSPEEINEDNAKQNTHETEYQTYDDENDSEISFHFATNDAVYDPNASYQTDLDLDTDDDRSVIIEGELYQQSDLCTIESEGDKPKPESDLVYKNGVFYIPIRGPSGSVQLTPVPGLSLKEEDSSSTSTTAEHR